jgi:hypothetical protein
LLIDLGFEMGAAFRPAQEPWWLRSLNPSKRRPKQFEAAKIKKTTQN